ncbi:sigma 54-interacting transcriptional regulator [Sporomusa termitida]|uniref:Anaerobic nitric oxide reductase transcription regulator NorR n=1 Tax=Sporomusa termitida TaxID=2377 RepID=A0A517DNW3_9FIRM|nr:sigma 54-interacting transcriptional regulator [Sporomusa termitida]QDR79051.1 Anaerobic nitric oxide reductase transcription regulator NorR [Sporomusa termitida]
MSDIVFISPSREAAALAVRMTAGQNDITIVAARLQEGVKAARAAVENGARVLVSRGFTHYMISEKMPHIPLVEVEFSGYDILRAYLEARQTGKPIAIVDSSAIVEGAASIEDILGIAEQSVKVIIDNYQDYTLGIERAAAAGAVCIVGNQAVGQQATARGLCGIVISSGQEALNRAFMTARHLLAVERLRDANVQQIETIINSVDYGILAINKEAGITAVNSEAERILSLARADSAAKENLIARLRQCMAAGDRQFGVIEKFAPGVEVVANYQSIISNGEVIGGVATLQELRHFQAVERKTREELARRGRVAKYNFFDIKSASPAMLTAIADAKHFAKYDATVLVLGETGVGKEYFAHAIHLASSRKNGPFVVVNCAAIPENILESELFGYTEGAFTGAKKGGKTGLFEQAHGGTIFLDEIGEMSENLQARLLRVLQEHEVYRLGDERVTPIDIRVIAATNRDLHEMVQKGRFREDLYYRLDVLTVEIPALRERKEDIQAFVQLFIAEFNAQYRTSVEGIAPAGLQQLQQYDWPGNIRELHNIIGRLSAQTADATISESDVKRVLKYRLRQPPAQAVSPAARSVDAAAIREALVKTGGNKQKAAELLGIGRATLWRKLKNMD